MGNETLPAAVEQQMVAGEIKRQASARANAITLPGPLADAFGNLEIKVRGYNLTLRKHEAELILVRG